MGSPFSGCYRLAMSDHDRPISPGPPALPARTDSWTARDLADLRRAKQLLENPGLTARLAGAVGRPIEEGLRMLPSGWQDTVARATHRALDKALRVAIASLGPGGSGAGPSERWHKILVGATGGVGGVFGLAALPIELPVSTALMLRSIASIARSEGHDLTRLETQLSCMEVFALGGTSRADDALDSAYWAVRAAMAKALSEALKYLGERRVIDHAAPALVRFVATVASRFGVVVSEEIVAKAVPVVGAAAGAAINVVFIDHFQAMARGHFVVKRLEARYGVETVRARYAAL